MLVTVWLKTESSEAQPKAQSLFLNSEFALLMLNSSSSAAMIRLLTEFVLLEACSQITVVNGRSLNKDVFIYYVYEASFATVD